MNKGGHRFHGDVEGPRIDVSGSPKCMGGRHEGDGAARSAFMAFVGMPLTPQWAHTFRSSLQMQTSWPPLPSCMVPPPFADCPRTRRT